MRQSHFYIEWAPMHQVIFRFIGLTHLLLLVFVTWFISLVMLCLVVQNLIFLLGKTDTLMTICQKAIGSRYVINQNTLHFSMWKVKTKPKNQTTWKSSRNTSTVWISAMLWKNNSTAVNENFTARIWIWFQDMLYVPEFPESSVRPASVWRVTCSQFSHIPCESE